MRFRNAVMRTVDSAVVMQAETQTVAIPKGAALMVEKQEHPTAGLTQLMSPKALQKALTQMNIQLANVLSDVSDLTR